MAYVLILLMHLCSCSYFGTQHDDIAAGKVIARAFDHYLYQSDIASLVPPKTAPADSAAIVKSYIDSWIKEKVMLHKASENMGDYEKQIEPQIEQYRNTLITYAYQKAVIKNQLDTIVSEAEIENYYNANRNNFLLKENITRCLYAKFKKEEKELKKVPQLLASNNIKDRENFDNLCLAKALDYFLNDDIWLSFTEVMKRTGIKTYSQEQFLQNNQLVEVPDSSSITFVRFYEFKIKESLSPLSFEVDNIRNLIINKRKLELINKLEQSAIDAALKNNEFEIFKN